MLGLNKVLPSQISMQAYAKTQEVILSSLNIDFDFYRELHC